MEQNRWNLLSDDGDDGWIQKTESKPTKTKEQKEKERTEKQNQVFFW